jgi:hypothetical protein
MLRFFHDGYVPGYLLRYNAAYSGARTAVSE